MRGTGTFRSSATSPARSTFIVRPLLVHETASLLVFYTSEPAGHASRGGRESSLTTGLLSLKQAARQKSLVLASVKSFFGSVGVNRQGFRGIADGKKRQHFRRYTLFNDTKVRGSVVREAAKRFGYPPNQVELRLYVGKFKSADEAKIRRHLNTIHAGSGPVKIIGLHEVLEKLLPVADSKTYYNDPVVITLKVLKIAGYLSEDAVTQR